jgi:hypothetical protein
MLFRPLCSSQDSPPEVPAIVNALAATVAPPVAEAKTTRVGGSFPLAVNAVALLAVALLMRAWRLGNIPGINGDEAWYGVHAIALARGESIDWWTPTGNPINVFFLFPLAALHAVFSPSVVLLRSVSVVSGVLALAANFWLCRKVFDARTAIVSTLLLALLPIDVAYSRFAWDASQTLLATVLVLYLPLWHYRKPRDAASLPVTGMIALVAAILVHPTNLFAAPLLAIPILYAHRCQAWKTAQQITVPAQGWILAALAAVSVTLAYFAWQALAGTAARLRGPEEFAAFLQNYLGLFAGGTVYEYISGVNAAAGPLAPFAWLPAICKWMFAAAVALGAWGMMRRLALDALDADVCLLIGWAVMFLAFFLVAGPSAIAPHFERYGIGLLAPAAVMLSRGFAWWIEPARSKARAATWILASAAWLFPATFYLGYFDFIERSGGCSHRAFRTAAVEPKLAALGFVTAHRQGAKSTRIVTSQWWNYWPLAYLAAREDDIRVISGQPWQRGGENAPPRESEQTWYIEFAGSPEEEDVLRRVGRSGAKVVRHEICDYSGEPLLSIVGPAECSAQNY